MKEHMIKALSAVKEQKPLVHCITNYVTVNDVANALLAIGGSPIMADDPKEVEEMTSIASALVINIGTLNQRTVASMILAGKQANQQGIPVVFDPVGAGASSLRKETTFRLLEEVQFSVIRGNLSEMTVVAGQQAASKGVDVSEQLQGKDGTAIAKQVATQYRCVAAITGAVDVISDGDRVVKISNGHPHLSGITGTGCTTTGMIGGFLAVTDPMTAATAAIMTMGIAGEIAEERCGILGNGSYRVAIMDAISLMDDCTLENWGEIQCE